MVFEWIVVYYLLKVVQTMSKVMTMKEAISSYVKSGDILLLSGMQHGEPSAAIHEVRR